MKPPRPKPFGFVTAHLPVAPTWIPLPACSVWITWCVAPGTGDPSPAPARLPALASSINSWVTSVEGVTLGHSSHWHMLPQAILPCAKAHGFRGSKPEASPYLRTCLDHHHNPDDERVDQVSPRGASFSCSATSPTNLTGKPFVSGLGIG